MTFTKITNPPQPPGELIIKEIENPDRCFPPVPPVILRQQPARPITPEPVIIREVPPPPPPLMPTKVVTVPAKKIPPPPRRVVLERLGMTLQLNA